MFKFLEKKVNNTISTFLTVGILCLVLGIAVLVNEFFWRIFVALVCFILSYIAFHIACRIQYVRDTMKYIFPSEKKHQSSRKK